MKKWLPLVVVSLGTFMLLVDVTIVNVALPDMATSLSTSFSCLQWVMDAYALALAALLLGVGSLADLVGHRRSYVGGLTLFALSSLACGLAPNVGVLIAARAVQGVGAAAMFATTFALLNASYQRKERGVAYGVWGAVSGASAAVGPVLGGVLTEGISWNWIFYVNLPVSVVAVALSLRALPADHPTRGGRVDYAGTATFSVAAGALTFGLIRANDSGWGSLSCWGSFLVAALALATFVVAETRNPEAMVDLSLFRRRSFVGTLLAALILNLAAFASLTYTSIWLQSVLGLSPIEAGLVGLPLAGAAFFVSAAIGRLLHHRAPGPIIGGGLLLIGLGSCLCAVALGDTSGWPALMLGYVVIGVGVGLATPTLSSSAMAAVPPQRGGMAAGMINTMRQLGFAIGIAVLGSVFASRAAAAFSRAGLTDAGSASKALAGGQAQRIIAEARSDRAAATTNAVHHASISGLHGAFWTAGIAGVTAGLLVLGLVRSRPAVRSERAPEAASVDAVDTPA
ncbi:drug resistance transporter, EmrB/QacA subfamily [Nakamurella panacisegetis]|uniref:Drug resistance transporter, EmrB/QacA subfamily n=1 Tax=Nakamurella panacisegetis TaxID=1090615 RepID=A0A1H0SCA7_9ACTN|nr:DHA2 family efflux MFS transporter permease subunit [Nakamurella panacisegetis]SDP39394.1 drug resistance transporter, EmrB/QacA subfamily [Nakamurella panacisegetis]